MILNAWGAAFGAAWASSWGTFTTTPEVDIRDQAARLPRGSAVRFIPNRPAVKESPVDDEEIVLISKAFFDKVLSQ